MARKRKKYRYISNGCAKPSDPIRNFRLIGGNQLKSLDCRFNDVIRVEIPEDMVLEKYSCDGYSTTEDTRTLEELKYNVIVRFKDGFVRRPDFEQRQPDESILDGISEKLREEGYYLTDDAYLDKHDYQAHMDRIADAAEERDKKAEELKKQLDARQCRVHELEYMEPKILLKIIELYVRENHKRSTTRDEAVKALVELSSDANEANKVIARHLGESTSLEERLEWVKKNFDAQIFSATDRDVKTDYMVLLQAIIDVKWRR